MTLLHRSKQRGPALSWALHEPAGEPRGAVLLTHGYGEHSGRYGEVVRAWTGRGLIVATYDLRGHGRSEGDRGHIDSFRDYVRDAEDLLDELAANDRWSGCGKPMLFGHSLGGLISTHIALSAQSRYRALAMTSPFFGLALEVPAFKAALGRGLSRIAPTFGLPSGLKGADVTRNAEIAREYDADPLNLKNATARWFTEAMTAQEDALEAVRHLRLPVLCLVAGDDRIASVEATRRVLERVGSEEKEISIEAGRFHELLNEPERAEYIERLGDRLLDWAAR